MIRRHCMGLSTSPFASLKGKLKACLLVSLTLASLWGCAETVWIHPDGRPLRGTVLFVNDVPRRFLVVIPKAGYRFELQPGGQKMVELAVRPGVIRYEFTVVIEGTRDQQKGTVSPGQKVEIYMVRAENSDHGPRVEVTGEWHRWGVRVWR